MRRTYRFLSWVIVLALFTAPAIWAVRRWGAPRISLAGGLPEASTLMSAALVGMSVTTLVAVLVAFYLYRWRRLMSSGKSYYVPEAWISSLDRLQREHQRLDETVAGGTRRTLTEVQQQSQKVSEIAAMFMKLQHSLDAKDAEIRRLKRGYDAEVFRQFLGRFIRLDHAIEQMIANGEVGEEHVVTIKQLCEDALEECGVERFEPPLGTDYRRVKGVADNPRLEVAETAEDDFTIARVDAPGYRLRTGGKDDIIKEASVTIRRMAHKEEAQT